MDENFFIGFSSVVADRNRRRHWTIRDSELIGEDILNEFNTRRGERVGRPTFGSIIWERLGDPMTPALYDEIVEDCIRICQNDPRVIVDRENISISKTTNGLTISIDLINRMSSAVLTISNDFEVSA